jgi:hypothetical protein
LAFEGALLILFGTAGCAAHAAHSEASAVGGCMLTGPQARTYLASAQARMPTGSDIIAQTGNRDFDYALAQTLSMLVDSFEVLPGFGFFKVGDVQNAYATPSRELSGTDGTVLLGSALLFSLMEQPENPDAGVAAVCAHEFGHIVQFKRGLVATLNAGQRSVKRQELNADFMSGYFAGLRKQQRPGFPATAFAATYQRMGDNLLVSPQHHGTAQERAAAIVRGFETAYREKQSLSDAIQTGVNYVSTL